MTEKELHDALDGLFAYDTGSVDSGIHDEALRRRVIDHLSALSEDDRRVALSRWVRGYLTDESLAQRHGIEDVAEAVEWLSDYMDIDIR